MTQEGAAALRKTSGEENPGFCRSFWEQSRELKEKRLIRLSTRFFSAAALAALIVPAFQAVAQQHVPPAPSAPTPQQTQPDVALPSSAPSAPTPAAPTFPKPDPANFTAPSPTKEVVNAFLASNWGYDDDRIWQVQAILKTSVDGLSKVIVLIGDKSGKEKPSVLSFFALLRRRYTSLPAIRSSTSAKNPFVNVRQKMEQQADKRLHGGAASKDLEFG